MSSGSGTSVDTSRWRVRTGVRGRQAVSETRNRGTTQNSLCWARQGIPGNEYSESCSHAVRSRPWSAETIPVGPFMQLGLATVTAAVQAGAHYFDSTGEGTFVRRVFELDSVATARGATVVPAFGYDYVPGNLAGALALTSAGDRATRMEIGYFLTRAGHGDALRYRSGLRDVFSLTTGGTRKTLVSAAADDAFAYRHPHAGAPARLVDERVGKRVRTFSYAGVTPCGDDRRRLGASGPAGSLRPAGEYRCVHGVVRAMDASDTDGHRAPCTPPAVGAGTGRTDLAVRAAPRIAP